jgi:hypothetical protein
MTAYEQTLTGRERHEMSGIFRAQIELGCLFVGMGRKMQQVRSSRERASALMSAILDSPRTFSPQNRLIRRLSAKIRAAGRLLARNLLNRTGTRRAASGGSTICGGS